MKNLSFTFMFKGFSRRRQNHELNEIAIIWLGLPFIAIEISCFVSSLSKTKRQKWEKSYIHDSVENHIK